ncbi:MAG: hypothetical protein OXF31_04420 [Gammaproteobacteria bacterium]|nr:hypothetical protein [Gammaproteobacteria bacterium]
MTTELLTKGQIIIPRPIRQHWEREMDFADALHLGASATCEAMLTFDRQFTEV